MGGEVSELVFSKSGPTVILLAGLQGVGKTTVCAKLACYLKKQVHCQSPLFPPLCLCVHLYFLCLFFFFFFNLWMGVGGWSRRRQDWSVGVLVFLSLLSFKTYGATLTIGQKLHAGCWRCI